MIYTRTRFKLALATIAFSAASLAHATDVGVSIQVGQPGFYGRIDIGGAPAPRVVYAEPVWVQRGPVRVEPIYLRVPPGHQKNWAKHCRRYDACGVPVYFVHEDWYRDRYEHRRDEREERRDDRRDERRDERGDERHDHGRHKGHDRD
jgi:hypothetical protein